MEILFNITAIRNKMDEIPKGNRIFKFFGNEDDQLSTEQMENIKTIIVTHYNEVIDFIDDKIKTNTTNQE